MVHLVLTAKPRSTVVVPVHTSSAVEQIARRHDSRVLRTKANPTALMEACHANSNVVLGGSSETGFIFPQLHPGFDAMFCIAKIMEMLTLHERTLGQMRTELPTVFHRNCTVRCPSHVKGALMRNLLENRNTGHHLEIIDGVKVCDYRNDRWILVLPDASEPLVHLFANSDERNWVDLMIQEYRSRIQNFVDRTQGIDEVSTERFI